MENENNAMQEAITNEVSENDTKQPDTEKRCPKCQALLTEEQLFCPECGTSLKKSCLNCGAELQEGQAFCPSCGQKLEERPSDINADIAEFNAGIEKKKNKKKILPIVLGALGICVIVIYLIFSIFLNPQYYIEKGDYKTAYNVASAAAKEGIVRENIVAVVSSDCVASLKDSSSFELRGAWISVIDTSRIIILEVAANNSFGNQVINYWYYSYDEEEETYSLITNFSDFEEETIYSWDDVSEELEKKINNIAKLIAESVISNDVQISDDSIENINLLFENDVLEDVTLIDVEPQDTE